MIYDWQKEDERQTKQRQPERLTGGDYLFLLVCAVPLAIAIAALIVRA